MGSERKFFLSLPEVWFLDATRFVRLVLAGVRVTNFLNIANFDLIFLHNTHILYVCLFVGLFVICFCLSCLSVCLSVCLSYVHHCICVNICLSVHLSVFQLVPVLLHCPSVCLFVCVCLYVFISVCLYVYLYICLSVPLSVCLSTEADPSVLLLTQVPSDWPKYFQDDWSV
jgi:hypothetical protein